MNENGRSMETDPLIAAVKAGAWFVIAIAIGLYLLISTLVVIITDSLTPMLFLIGTLQFFLGLIILNVAQQGFANVRRMATRPPVPRAADVPLSDAGQPEAAP